MKFRQIRDIAIRGSGRVSTQGGIGVSLCFLLFLLAGCSDYSSHRAGMTERGHVPPVRHFLSSVRMPYGMTARSALSCPAGDCIVLHFPVKFLPMTGLYNVGDRHEFDREVQQLLEGDANTIEDDGEILQKEGESWNLDRYLGGSQVTFNCCTYAMADVVGLSESDWISPNAIDATNFTVPMQILLDSYFQMIHSEPASLINWHRLESEPLFAEGDVFCFVFSNGDQQEYTHVGKILPKTGRNWLIHKYGRGPVMRSNLKTISEIYQDKFTEIRVYRPISKVI